MSEKQDVRNDLAKARDAQIQVIKESIGDRNSVKTEDVLFLCSAAFDAGAHQGWLACEKHLREREEGK